METTNFNHIWKATGQQTITIAGQKYPVIQKPEWKYRSADGRFSQDITLIDKNVFYFENSGHLDDEKAWKVFKRNMKLYREFFSIHEQIYVISNFSQLSDVSRKVRKLIKGHLEQFSFTWVLFGVNPVLKALMKIFSGSYGFRMFLAKDFTHAFLIIQDEKKNQGFEYEERRPGPQQKDEAFTEKINMLTGYLQDLSLKEEIPYELPELDEEDILSELFWITRVVSHDIKDSFEEINLLNKKIIEQNQALTQSLEKIRKINADLETAKDAAEEGERLKSMFLADMSHEIRTPANVIMGFARILQSGDLDKEDRKKYLTIIERSGSKMLRVLDDLSDMARIEKGELNVELEETNVNEQMEFIRSFFELEAELKGLKLVFLPKLPDDQVRMLTDKEKLHAILSNLVKNAIKYSEEGVIELGYERREPNLEFFVKDEGPGIRPEEQESIFERLHLQTETTERPKKSARIGLAICKAFVEILGGRIWVDSDGNKGAVFYFTLPYRRGTN